MICINNLFSTGDGLKMICSNIKKREDTAEDGCYKKYFVWYFDQTVNMVWACKVDEERENATNCYVTTLASYFDQRVNMVWACKVNEER